MTSKHPGRPVSERETQPHAPQEDARSKLLAAARQCFLSQPYDKVTTRQIAELAGVNKALISYYFNGKQELLKAVMLEIVTPVLERLKQARRDSEPTLEGAMLRFAEVMSDNLDFPPLMSQVLLNGDHPLREQIIDQVLRPGLGEMRSLIRQLQHSGQLPADLQPEQLTVAVQSLLVAPVLMRPVLASILEKKLDSQFIGEQIRFHSQLINLFMRSAESGTTTVADPSGEKTNNR